MLFHVDYEREVKQKRDKVKRLGSRLVAKTTQQTLSESESAIARKWE